MRSQKPKLVIWGFNGCLLDNARDSKSTAFFADAYETVSTLAFRGHTQAIVTVSPEIQCRRLLRKLCEDPATQTEFSMGSAQFFRDIRGDVKEKPPVYLELLGLRGFESEDAVGITDDITEAWGLFECGIKAIVVPRGVDKLDYIVECMPSVPDVVVAHTLKTAIELFELR
jgi:phosphoserine phosphatase